MTRPFSEYVGSNPAVGSKEDIKRWLRENRSDEDNPEPRPGTVDEPRQHLLEHVYARNPTGCLGFSAYARTRDTRFLRADILELTDLWAFCEKAWELGYSPRTLMTLYDQTLPEDAFWAYLREVHQQTEDGHSRVFILHHWTIQEENVQHCITCALHPTETVSVSCNLTPVVYTVTLEEFFDKFKHRVTFIGDLHHRGGEST